MRALSAFSVLLFHVWPTLLPGGFVGVDAFFVISGFLITGLLVRELEATGHISLPTFYVRRAKRLLPAATLVLLAAAGLTMLWLPVVRWRETGDQIFASALYYENWFLHAQAIDYWATGAPKSPVQHYWSLSIEEQFYFVWPCILALAAFVARRTKLDLRRTLFALTAAVFCASLYYSITYTPTHPAQAYFSTFTRAWELSLGGCLVLVNDRLRARLGERLLALLGALGLVLLLSSFFWIDEDSVFPGWIGLAPTVGTALLLLARQSGGKRSAGRLLSLKPFVHLGDRSYSIYLWHWPLVAWYAATYDAPPDLAAGGLIVLWSLVLAHFSRVGVELPVQRSELGLQRRWTALGFALACVMASVSAAAVPVRHVEELEATLLADRSGHGRGAAAFVGAVDGVPVPRADDPNPSPLVAKEDVSPMVRDGCHLDEQQAEPRFCRVGNPDGALHVALVGDSHAAQWLPALAALAERFQLDVVAATKSSCPLTDALLQVGHHHKHAYSTCQTWNQKLMRELLELKPNLVIHSQYAGYTMWGVSSTEESKQRLLAAAAAPLLRLKQAGIRVLSIRDTPHMGFVVPECLARGRGLDACSQARNVALNDEGWPGQVAIPGIELADLTEYLCTPERCPPIVGGVIVYRDAHHLTATYAKTLAPMLWPFLEAALQH